MIKLKDWILENKNLFFERDLRYLIKEVFSLDTSFVFINDLVLEKDQFNYLENIKKLYIEGLPLAYILNKEDFFGFTFKINTSALIPRKETEIILEKAIELIKVNDLKTILDLGCGCGVIAIVLKKIFKKIEVFASDISLEALKLTKTNAEFHNVELKLINTDLFRGFKKNCFDLIISNPPYVETNSIKGSLKYEPKIALDGGENGLYFINRILKEGFFYLKKEGFLVLEIGALQKDSILKIVKDIDYYEVIDLIKDYDKNFRGVILKIK